MLKKKLTRTASPLSHFIYPTTHQVYSCEPQL